MCRYLQVFCMKYLHIPTAVCLTILLYFSRNTYTYLLLYLSLSCCISQEIPTHTYCCICRYLSVFLKKYLHIPTAASATIQLNFKRNTVSVRVFYSASGSAPQPQASSSAPSPLAAAGATYPASSSPPNMSFTLPCTACSAAELSDVLPMALRCSFQR